MNPYQHKVTLRQIQRKLQLRIEEQGRRLEMMLEKQCNSCMDKLQIPSVDIPKSSNKNEIPEKSPDEAGNSRGSAEATEGFRQVSHKDNSDQKEEVGGSHFPACRRAKSLEGET